MLQEAREYTAFGEWVMRCVQSRGWKQSGLAVASGIKQSTLSSYLTGARKLTSPATAGQIAAALFDGDVDSEPERYAAFRSTALRLAGFATEPLPVAYLPAEEELYVAAEEDSLTTEDVEEIRDYIRMKRERARRRRILTT